jgi:hypothetical protein
MCDGTLDGTMAGVFLADESACKPHFQNAQVGAKAVLTSKLLAVPVSEDDRLLFVVQLEISECVKRSSF